MRDKFRKIVLLFVWVLAGISLLTSCQQQPSQPESIVKENEDTTIFTIDGYPVSSEEFDLFLRAQRASTAQHFYEVYGAENDGDFWTTEYDGQTPEEYNEEKALEEITAYKMERILACERGITESVDYSDLMQEMDAVNEKNGTGRQNGEIAYGVKEYSPWQYLNYIRSKCSSELLKDECRRCKDSISEETLKERYEEERQAYHKGYDVTYERFDMDLSEKTEELNAFLQKIADRAQEKKISLEDAAKELNITESYTVQEFVSSEVVVSKDDLFEQEILQDALELEEGAVSEPFVSTSGLGVILRCINRKDLGYYSFEEVKDNMIELFAKESLQKLLDERIQAAEIIWVEK